MLLVAGPDGSRKPTELELEVAKHQVWAAASRVLKLLAALNGSLLRGQLPLAGQVHGPDGAEIRR